MTECSKCGVCCDPVLLTSDTIALASNLRISPRERRWLLEDLKPMSRKEAKAKVPWAFESGVLWRNNVGQVSWPLFYRCQHFNEETRQCESHHDLPETCSGFPWFGAPPHPHAVLPPECSYNVDVGRPVQIIKKPS